MASPATSSWTYDVFLNFSSEDAGNKFSDHLFAALYKKGITAYRNESDDLDRRGIHISPRTDQAIRRSRFAVVVFTQNYASSLACLEELVSIVESHGSSTGQTILPVFYYIEPTAVRYQIHSFKEAFDEYEKVYKDEFDLVQKWRAALQAMGNLSGWHLQDKSETQCIQEIVQVILDNLNDSSVNVIDDDFVGIDDRANEILSYVRQHSTGVLMIGICGAPGVGKTTIARAVCDKLLYEFKDHCFLANVGKASRKHGLEKLQEQILSDLKQGTSPCYDTHQAASRIQRVLRPMKVLLILDGVDDLKQLKMLAGSRDWFGEGSRIIITTQNEDLFRNYEVDNIYRLGELKENEALRLLCLKAFKQVHPPDEYIDLCKHIVSLTNGIPASIEELGSFLYGRSVAEWASTIRRSRKERPL